MSVDAIRRAAGEKKWDELVTAAGNFVEPREIEMFRHVLDEFERAGIEIPLEHRAAIKAAITAGPDSRRSHIGRRATLGTGLGAAATLGYFLLTGKPVDPQFALLVFAFFTTPGALIGAAVGATED